MSLIHGQGRCVIEDAQKLTIRIRNCTQRAMDLSLGFDKSFSKREQFLWIGTVSKHLGKLGANQTFDVELQLVPLTCGLKVKGNFRFFFFLSKINDVLIV